VPSARDAAFEELTLEERWPSVYAELLDIRRVLEKRFGCVCDFEFTVEDGRLYILGVRKAKRTRVANLRFALQFFEEGVIGLSEALARIDASDILEFVRPAIANLDQLDLLGRGLPASPGAAVGRVVTSREEATSLAQHGEDVIYVRAELEPEDIEAMSLCRAVLTARGGMTSHAAVVSRGMGIPCVAGFSDLALPMDGAGRAMIEGRALGSDDWMTIDGTSGSVYLGRGEAAVPSWRKIPELRSLAGIVDAAVLDDSLDHRVIGKAWQFRDFFAHAVMPVEEHTSKRSVRVGRSISFDAPSYSHLAKTSDSLHEVLSGDRDWCRRILLGLSATMSRVLAGRLGLGNHHLYFRPLWDPNTEAAECTCQLVGFEFFDVNRYIRHLPDIGELTFLLRIKLEGEGDRWFLDVTNPRGEGLVAGLGHIAAFMLLVNGAEVSFADLPALYSILRRREYFWNWYAANHTSYEQLRDCLSSVSKGAPPETRHAIYCQELGLLDPDGTPTRAGRCMLGQEERERTYAYWR